MRKSMKSLAIGAFCAFFGASGALGFTTAPVPADGVYKFTFGASEVAEGCYAVPASAVCDVNGTYTDTFSYGFLGTTDTSYLDDVPSNLPSVPHAIDGFSVVKGQKIVLHDDTDANGKSIVYGPAPSEYLPEGASSYEGRYPIRFSARMPERGYYAVSCTVANASSTETADVTLFSERCHTHAQHLTLAPGETKEFSWSVELAPNYFKGPAKFYYDNAINIVIVGKNAALASVTVTKQPTTTENAKVRGVEQERINVGKTIWLCDDSTGTDQRCDTPYFALQNYAGTGSGLSRWAPPALSIRNQGEGGLATNARVHRESCLLKPGDYLYVQYGHNESGTESYKANLDQYLDDANAAGANLIVVSPVERHTSWNAETETYGRSLLSYAEAGEEWVEAKIADGAKNVAFVDLNKTFNDWQNEEIKRINSINPAVSKKAAIEFYYQSSKGGKVDVSHPNNAGADWGAYCFWKDAAARVAAGQAEGAADSQKIQAAVLSGIIDGVAQRVATDEPWRVSDEIIAAGASPNSFWDTPVKAGFDFANDAAVAAVDAVCADGVVTLSGVSMRVMNQLNYAKAVIDIVNADGSSAGRWYSFYNYDASGTAQGGIVRPEQPGFISADLDKNTVSTESAEYSTTLTIPAGGKAYIWFAEADGTTWQVGENGPISAKYPLEAWTGVLVDDDCTNAATWGVVTKDAVRTFEVPEGEDYIAFTSTARNSGGYHSDIGFYRDFDNGAEISSGRYRVSFKALYARGNFTFKIGNSHGSNSAPLDGSLDLVQFNNTAATVFGSAAAEITLSADEMQTPQNNINVDTWLDIDMIVDMSLGRAEVSVGGGDYQTFNIAAYADPDEIPGLPYKCFGLRLWTYSTHAGAIDDLKIVALAPSPTHTVSASVNNGTFGSVTISGKAAVERTIAQGKDVALSAVSADPDLYKFVRWEDADGNTVSTKTTLVIEDLAADCSYKAIFAEYAEDEDRVITWDFSEYAVAGIFATGNQTVDYNGMRMFLQSGDSVSSDGVCWVNVGSKAASNPGPQENGRQVQWTATNNGRVSVAFQTGDTGKISSKGMPVYVYVYAYANGSVVKSMEITENNIDKTFTFDVVKGTTYTLWSYYYLRDSSVSIKSITYTYTPVFDATFDVGEGDTDVKIGIPSKTANVTKTGDGTLVFVGNNAFSGSLLVGAGTLKLGSPLDISGMIYDFDASADEAIVCDGESVTGIKDRLGLCENLYPQGVAGAVSSINGKQAVSITERYRTVESMRAGATFFACQYLDSAKSWNALMKQVVDKEENPNNYSITEYNDGVLQRRWSNGSSAAGSSGRCGTENLYKNGGTSTAIDANPMVFTVNMAWQNGSSAVWYGPHKSFAIGEILAYSSPLSTAERVAVEEYLMAKWGIGNVAYAPIPASAGVEIAAGATLDLGGLTQRVASLSVAVGGVVTNGTLIVASAPSIDEQAFAAATDNGDGTWTVVWKDVDIEVDTHSFVWNWNVASGDWNNPANWLYEGKVAATTYPSDATADYVTFNTAATVNIASGAAAKEVWFNAPVTLAGGTLTTQLATTWENQGNVTLSNAGFANLADYALTINVDIVMTAETTNWFNTVSDTDWGKEITINGNISGKGSYQLNLAKHQGCGIQVKGNNNEFYGDVYTTGGASNRSRIWWGENAMSTNAFVHLGHSYRDRNDKDNAGVMGGNVNVGGYDGAWYDTWDGGVLTIGYLGRESKIDIYNYVSGRASSVVKLGTAKLTLGTTTIKDLTIEAGSVTMPAGIAPNTLTLAADTMIYIPASAEWTAGNTYDLFSYTTLKGAGELARQVTVTGLADGLEAEISIDGTTVTATIVASAPTTPTTDDEGAVIVKDAETGAYTITTEAEALAITVPEGVTVGEVVVSPATMTVTGVPEGAKISVMLEGEKYEIVKLVDSAVELDGTKSAVVEGEAIPVTPALTESGDEEAAPLAVDAASVAVGVKAIPGLTYRLVRGSSPTEIATPAAEEKATGRRVSLEDKQPPHGSAFYRIHVGLK